MPAIILPGRRIRRNFKPDFPVRLRAGHPLAKYLSSLTLPNDTNPVDLVSGRMDWAKVGTIGPSISQFGRAVKGNGSTDYLSRSINVSRYRPHLMLAVFEATVVSATPKTIYSLGSALSGSSAYIRISNGSDTTTPIMAQIRSVDNSNLHVATGPVPTVGELYACAWYVSSTSSADNKLWVNGTSYTATGSTLQASGSGTFVHEAVAVLRRGTLAHYSPDHILLVARGIPPLGTDLDAVLRAWTQNPWDLLEPKRSRTVVMLGSGGTIDLAGTPQAAPSVTAVLTLDLPLAGAALSASSANAAMSIPMVLDGAATAQVMTDGSIDIDMSLSVAAIAQALAQADVTMTQVLGGTGQGQASATGDLSAGQTDLAGSTQAQTSAQGDLNSTQAIAGSSQAQTSASGDLDPGGMALGGSASGQASVTGDLAVKAVLSGTPQAQPSASGDITVANLEASAQAQPSSSGDLAQSNPLDGTAQSQASAAGDVDLGGTSLSGSSVAQASGLGTMTVTLALAGSDIAQAVAEANLSSGNQFAGSAVANPVVAGALVVDVPITGQAQAQVTGLGNVVQLVPVAGSSVSVVSVNGQLLVSLDLNAQALAQAVALAGLDVAYDYSLSGQAQALPQALAQLNMSLSIGSDAIVQASAAGLLDASSGLPIHSAFMVTAQPLELMISA